MIINSSRNSVEFKSDFKDIAIECIPNVGYLGLYLEYRIKKGLNYACYNGKVLIFDSFNAANSYVNRNAGKIS